MCVNTSASASDVKKNIIEVKQIRFLTDHTFVLRFDRGTFDFKPGQYLTAGLKDSLQHREYSVYSSENDNYLEIMVREVNDGDVSVQLKNSKVGQLLEINGPLGFMKVNPDDLSSKKFVLIASGTGIAPFHSFVKSYVSMDYTLLHGVKYAHEAYERSDYDPQRYVLCTSREKSDGFYGRVTDYLRDFQVTDNMLFYVCGNSNMIYEVYNILRNKGIGNEKIFSEVYF
jgi:ferredoxin--NADP+ reductase/benzoate/toluate 1,2-dioxygenase reductase subunit